MLSPRGPSRRLRLTLTAAALLVLAALVVLAVRAPHGVPGVPTYRLDARFADLSGLTAGDDVRIGGVRVGQVDAPERSGETAQVTLKLQRDVRALPAGTRAEVRSRGLLGARFLELLPGDGSAGRGRLADGAVIPVTATGATVDLPTMLLAFDAPTRANLRATLDGLGGGFADQGVGLNDVLRRLPAQLRRFTATATALTRGGELRRLAPGLDRALAAVDPVREELAAALAPAADAAEPFASGRRDVATTLQVAPGALARTRQHLAGSSALLAETRRLSRSLQRTLPRAPAALRATATLLRHARAPLARATPLLDAARAASPATARMVAALPPLLTMLDDTVGSATPLVRKLGAIGCDIHRWGSNWASMLNVGVTVPRGDERLGPMTSLRLTAGVTPDQAERVLNANGVHLVAANPFPAPCQAGTEKLP